MKLKGIFEAVGPDGMVSAFGGCIVVTLGPFWGKTEPGSDNGLQSRHTLLIVPVVIFEPL